MNCNKYFQKGKITILMDGGAGSSGKGRIGSYITENSNNWTFCINTFMPQAGHWVKLDDGRKFFYQTFNSCAYNHNKFEKMYLASGCVIELAAFIRELEENNIPRNKIGISPCATVLQDIDSQFERGEVDLDGNRLKELSDGTMAKGSTAHGCGAAVARKALRKGNTLYAKDVPELKEFICNVEQEVMERLDRGESGWGELAQGYQLSLNHPYFLGYTTSRDVTTSRFMADCFLPTKYAGPVIINLRSYPIRISNKKYIAEDGKHLIWEDVKNGVPHTVKEYNSGPWYQDQKEVDWDFVTKESGSPTEIIEMTSVTKLPRRVATFSRLNVTDAIKHNDTGNGVYLSLNFCDYVDSDIADARSSDELSPKFLAWVNDNFSEEERNMLHFIGTGPKTESTVYFENGI